MERWRCGLSKTNEITVLSNGQTKVETQGFVGAECRQASQLVERELGHQTDEVLKTKFHQTATPQNQIRQCELFTDHLSTR
ncbi:DUF2997 domain-containing protein [Novipirellula galeiformis]|uniref:DUF2997 domain-containing protein n=1 Tax=Novipirellula galeiformis TaxID=2528004 RepID=UPI0028F44C67|nr:DUF2997 domain-containing protein [Novipirellula galeiformis]